MKQHVVANNLYYNLILEERNEKETNIIHRHVYGKRYGNGSKRKREFGKD